MKTTSPRTSFPALLQRFFLERLIQQRNASVQTVAAYRDSFRLLLHFAQRHLGKAPETLTLSDLDAPLMMAFLNYLESERHNKIRSRNARFAAIRSFLHFAALHEPTALPVIQRVLAIPMKRFDKPLLGFLSRNEMQAILDAPDAMTWCGHRDRAMFMVFYNTGGRVSEITGLKVADVVLDGCAAVRLHGKGRKERCVPLWRTTVAEIRRWLARTHARTDQPLFPGWSGTPLSRPAVTARLQLAVRRAAVACPQLAQRRISPHTIRHATAMQMLQAGVDITLIALWLGHESPATTHMYVEADLAMKERALNTIQPPHLKRLRYQPPDRLLHFLETL
jgi:site-specific recombinase XerD